MAEFAGQWGPEGIEYPNGQHAANTIFEVRRLNGELTTLYSDKDYSSTVPNPGVTDEFGNLTFFAFPASYLLTIGGRFTVPISVNLHPDEQLASGGGSSNPMVDWFRGNGPPTVVIGAGPGDMYVDELTGTLYQLR